jgi:hypothetical protein
MEFFQSPIPIDSTSRKMRALGSAASKVLLNHPT